MRPTLMAAMCAALAGPAMAQTQGPDLSYRPVLAAPAYAEVGPLIQLDAAHGSVQTIDGRYAGFAALVRADGYQIRAGEQALDTPGALDGVDILVISNAQLRVGGPETSAFTVPEISAIEAWVRAGGSLLLAADHAPHGVAAEALGEAFGVRMGTGYAFRLTPGGENAVSSQLMFSTEAGTLGDHPILRGRNADEAVDTVKSFTGQSLAGPAGSTILMALLPTDREAVNSAVLGEINDRIEAGEAAEAVLADRSVVALSAQGLAFEHGAGRVVVLGEAGMLTAQRLDFPEGDAREDIVFGLQTDGHDDQQFALNILHWLSRLI